MTEQTKAVFSNPKLLREKLNEFLQTPNSIESYALAAEAFFAAGGKERLKYKWTKNTTLAWCLILGYMVPLYRKCYGLFFLCCVVYFILPIFIVCIWLIIGNVEESSDKTLKDIERLCVLAINFILTLTIKFQVIKRFEKALDLGEAEFIKKSGRINPFLVFAIHIIFIFLIALLDVMLN